MKTLLSSSIKRIATAVMYSPCKLARASRKYASPDEIASKKNLKILIVACHWIGDTLWAAQVMPCLRERWPDANISVVTKSFSFPLWSGCLSADETINGDAIVSDRRREHVDWLSLRKLAKQLAKRNWDMVIDLTGNRYSAIFCHLIRAGYTIGFDGGEFGALYAARAAEAERPVEHLSQRPFRVIQPLLKRFAYTGEILPPKPAGTFTDACGKYSLDQSRPLAIIAPGAGWLEKCWGTQNFADVASIMLREGWQIVLIGSPRELELSQDILRRLDSKFHSSVHIVHEDTLNSALTLLSGASAFVGNDSGLGHIAAAMGIPTIAIFTGETCQSACRPLGKHAQCVSAGSSAASPDAIAKSFMGES